MIVCCGLGVLMMQGQPGAFENKFACVTLALLVGWAQVGSSLTRAVLNMHHDARSISQVVLADALCRVALIPLCAVWPNAVAALLGNLAGAAVGTLVSIKRCRAFCATHVAGSDTYRSDLVRFVRPLAPTIIYTLAQGQLAILLLSFYAQPSSVAEVGALGRLSQICALISLLNPFLVQPLFARIESRRDLQSKVGFALCTLFIICAGIYVSAIYIPQAWLFLLGEKYSDLTAELLISMATAIATLVGGTIYTIVISSGRTSWQGLALVPCIGGQVVFLAINGVTSTRDALLLNLIPPVGYALTQFLLLGVAVSRWPYRVCAK